MSDNLFELSVGLSDQSSFLRHRQMDSQPSRQGFDLSSSQHQTYDSPISEIKGNKMIEASYSTHRDRTPNPTIPNI